MSKPHVVRFSIDVLGFTAQQTSDMLVGSYPLFTAMMADELPEVDQLTPGMAARCDRDDPTVLCRELKYELNAVVWEPLQAILQVAAPGLISYNDVVRFSTVRPGFVVRTEWAGAPGIPGRSLQVVSSMTAVDDALGCRLSYEMAVRCTLPLVGGLIQRTIGDSYQKTIERVPRVIQRYYAAFSGDLA